MWYFNAPFRSGEYQDSNWPVGILAPWHQQQQHWLLLSKNIIYIALFKKINTIRPKCHYDEILVIGCTESCRLDNFRCIQWPKFRHNYISVTLWVWYTYMSIKHNDEIKITLICCQQNYRIACLWSYKTAWCIIPYDALFIFVTGACIISH